MPDVSEGIVIDFGITGIIVAAYAVILLVLAVLSVAVLFRQKKLLTQINNTLMRQGVPPAGYASPAPNTCPKCGAIHAPEAGFCHNCGAPVQ
jgi:uncharacterized paraquat-inducible protein A